MRIQYGTCLGYWRVLRAGIVIAFSFSALSCTTAQRGPESAGPSPDPNVAAGLQKGLAWIIGEAEGRSSPRKSVFPYRDLEDRVHERDARVRAVLRELPSLSKTGSFECLVVDALVADTPSQDRYDSIALYSGNGMGSELKTRISGLGFIEVPEPQWEVLRKLTAKLIRLPVVENHLGICDGWDAVVFCIYDGRHWVLKRCFAIKLAGVPRYPLESDILVFQLLQKIWALQERRPKFAEDTYGDHSLLFEPEQRHVLKCLNEGKKWIPLGQLPAEERNRLLDEK